MRYKKDTNKGSYTSLYMFNYNRNYRDSNKTFYTNYCSNYNYINRDTMRDNQTRCNKLKKFLSNKDTTPAVEFKDEYTIFKWE